MRTRGFPAALASMLAIAAIGCSATPDSALSPSGEWPATRAAHMLGGGEDDAGAPDGKAVLDALQKLVTGITKKLDNSIVYVEYTFATPPKPASRFAPPPPATVACTGLALDDKGHVLISGALERSNIRRIEVWIGDVKHEATLAESDNQNGLSIVAVKTEKVLTPVVFSDAIAVETGQWLVMLESSGKEQNFQKFPEIGMVSGTIMGKTDSIAIANTGRFQAGTPAIDADGRIRGISNGGSMEAVYDLKPAIDELMRRVAGGQPATGAEVDPKKRPWLGIYNAVINEDYAEAMGLPKSAIMVRNVVGGSPAAQGGLKDGDLIVSVEGRPIAYSGDQALAHFQKMLRPEFGRKVKLGVRRDGAESVIEVAFGKKPDAKEYKAEETGVEVVEITDIHYIEHDLMDRQGVLVTKTLPGSPAARSSGFRESLISPNDVILEFAGHKIETLDDFRKAVEQARAAREEVVLVKLRRGRLTAFEALNLKIGRDR